MAIWDSLRQDPMSAMILMQGLSNLTGSMSKQNLPPRGAYTPAGYGQQGGGMGDMIPQMLRMQQMQAQQANMAADNELQRKQFEAEQAAAQQQAASDEQAARELGVHPSVLRLAREEFGKRRAEHLGAHNVGADSRLLFGDKQVAGALPEYHEGGLVNREAMTYQPLQGAQEYGFKKAALGRPDQRVIIPPGPNAYENTRYTDAAKQWSNIQNASVASSQRLADLKVLDAVLAPEKTGGLLQDEQLALERMAGQIGLPVDKESIANRQYAQQLATKMLLNQINAPSTEMVGVLSKTDTDMYKEMQPGLGTTPEGRKLAIEVEEALNEHARKLASGMRQYERQKGGIMTPIDQYDYLDAFSQQNSALSGVYKKWEERGKGQGAPLPGDPGGAEPPPVPRGGAGGLSIAPDVEARMRAKGY